MNTPVNTTLQTLLYVERLHSLQGAVMVIYICIKFQENISNSFLKLQSGHKYITDITVFKVQKAITPKVS